MLQTAIAAVRAAGKIQREHYGKLLNVDAAKRNDIKLEVDRLCEAAIVKIIRREYPGHALLAEESGADDTGSEYLWVIDPLDGTVNYFYGLPYFCSCVGCYRRGGGDGFPLGEPVAGAVYAAATDELFAAAAGTGATLNGSPIRAPEIDDLGECIVATGYGSVEVNIVRMRELSERLAGKVRKLRLLGAAGLDLCHVAAGRLSAYYERGLHPWDVGAAYAVLREAGAAVTAVEYEPGRWEVLASARGVHAALLREAGLK